MSVIAVLGANRQATIVPGLYRWGGRIDDTGDGTGGTATLSVRIQDSGDVSPALWYWLTEIWYEMKIVTAQAAQLVIASGEWPEIDLGVNQVIGIPAPIMDADTFGASAPVAAMLPHPLYLGQPKTLTDIDLSVVTTNTDTMTHGVILRGWATQYPIDPRPYLT